MYIFSSVVPNWLNTFALLCMSFEILLAFSSNWALFKTLCIPCSFLFSHPSSENVCSTEAVLFFMHLGHLRASKVPAVVKAEAQKAALPIEVPTLSLEELKEKTDNFGSKALIGEGSYGRVYYATLNNGKNVAVKKLDVSSEPDSNVEFLTQVC